MFIDTPGVCSFVVAVLFVPYYDMQNLVSFLVFFPNSHVEEEKAGYFTLNLLSTCCHEAIRVL